MAISSDLIKDFVKVTNDTKPTKSESTLYGKIVIYNDREYVQLDGSDVLTPISSSFAAALSRRCSLRESTSVFSVTASFVES